LTRTGNCTVFPQKLHADTARQGHHLAQLCVLLGVLLSMTQLSVARSTQRIFAPWTEEKCAKFYNLNSG
jgi:hypothetical protein